MFQSEISDQDFEVKVVEKPQANEAKETNVSNPRPLNKISLVP